jgi:Putative quorum-sensing-regulated virulence factor
MDMPFGRYKGRDLRELPDAYLRWLMELPDLYGSLRDAVEDEWRRRKEPKRERPREPPTRHSASDLRDVIDEIVTAGYRAVAFKHHPDREGTTAQMQRINMARDLLRQRWL